MPSARIEFMKRRAYFALILLVLASGGVWRLLAKRQRVAKTPLEAAAALAEATAHPERPDAAGPLLDALQADLAVHQKLILVFADETSLKGALARESALHAGHQLHHERIALTHDLNQALLALCAKPSSDRDPVVSSLLDWIENGPGLVELDHLAFRDPLRILQLGLSKDSSTQGSALRSRISQDLAEVDRVEAKAESEYRQVFGGPGVKPQGGERKIWQAYVEHLRRLYPEIELKPPPAPGPQPEIGQELSGREFPEKVLVLTFDDGPNRIYTEEIKNILQQNQAPAVFFEVGRNLGTLDGSGAPKLGSLSNLTEDLVKSGFVVGNHSYSHAQLSKETGKPLDIEIGETDNLLKAIPGAHSQLFRFPYGARTRIQLQALEPYHLRSVLWNIDSLDWADPVPSSVADRVLRSVTEEKRGIILFHDIHDRAGKVLPGLLERLRADGYRFAGLDKNGDLVMP